MILTEDEKSKSIVNKVCTAHETHHYPLKTIRHIFLCQDTVIKSKTEQTQLQRKK